MLLGAVVDAATLALVVTVDTEKLEVNAPSPSAVDTASDPDVIITGAENPMPNCYFFLFPTFYLRLKFSEFEQFMLNLV